MAPKKKTLGKGKLEVERIVSDKYLGGKHLFFVKWKGLSSRDNTWEPKRNLSKYSRLIREYFHDKGLRNSKSQTSALQSSINVSKQRRSSIDSMIAAAASPKSSCRLEPLDVSGSKKETKPSVSGQRMKSAANSVLDADGPLIKLVRIDHLINLSKQKDVSDAKSIADMAISGHVSEAPSISSVELAKIIGFEMNDTGCNNLFHLNNRQKYSDSSVALPRIPPTSVDSMEVNGEDTPTLVSSAGDIDAKKPAEMSPETLCHLETSEVATTSPIQHVKIVGFGMNISVSTDQSSVNDQWKSAELNVASSRVFPLVSANLLEVEVEDTSVIVSSAADIDAETPVEVSLANSFLLETSKVAPASVIELAKIVALNTKYTRNRHIGESNMINRLKCSDLVVSLPRMCLSGLVYLMKVEDTAAMVSSTAVINTTNLEEISQNLCLIPETFEAAVVPSVDEFPIEDTRNKPSVLDQQKCKALTVRLPKIIAMASVRSIWVATDDTATTVSSGADINLQDLVERFQPNSYQLETLEAAPVPSVDSVKIHEPEDGTRQSNTHSTCSDLAVALLQKISAPATVDSSQIEVDSIAFSGIDESNLCVDKEETCSLGTDTLLSSETVSSKCGFSIDFKPNAAGITVRPLDQSPRPEVLTPAPVLDNIEDRDEELLTVRPFAGDRDQENVSWMGKKSHRGKKNTRSTKLGRSKL